MREYRATHFEEQKSNKTMTDTHQQSIAHRRCDNAKE